MIDSVTLERSSQQAAILAALNEIHQRFMVVAHGHLPNDVPELGNTKPEYFGISMVTKDGHVFDVGDYDIPFTLQNLSHPFLYSLALDDWGRDLTMNYVDLKSSNRPSTSFQQMDSMGYLPESPMARSGAIAMASLVDGNSPTERLNRLIDRYSQFMGHKVHVDISTFMSSRQRSHHLRALAYLMVNAGMLDQTRVEEILELYLQQTSVLTTGHDLAVMAATLANHGTNPLTGKQVIDGRYVKDVLSVMAVSGLGVQSSPWLFQVGLPAAAGVSGGLIAVVPNQCGIAIYSPLLDDDGVSIRGRLVCEELSKKLHCHLFNGQGQPSELDKLARESAPALSTQSEELLDSIGNPADLDPVIIPLLENDIFTS